MEPAYPSSFLPHFYLALIGIPSCFFIGILMSPCWFSIGMKFCEIISEPFILVFQFVNRCMPWMFPVSEVYTLENKINYHWKNCHLQVMHIFCAFAHMLERPFYVRWVMWLYSSVPPKCLSSPPTFSQRRSSVTAATEHFTRKGMPMLQYRKGSLPALLFSVARTNC